MSMFLAKVKRIVNQIKGLIPSTLPQGTREFEAWLKSLRSTYDLPTSDVDSIKNAVCTMIMHFGPTEARKAPYYFVKALRAGAAKQIAYDQFQAVHAKKAAQQKAAQDKAKQEAEATANKQHAEATALSVAHESAQSVLQ